MDAFTVFTLTTLRDGTPDCSVHMTREDAEQALLALLRDALGEEAGETLPVSDKSALRTLLERAGIDLEWAIAEKPLQRPEWFRAYLDLSTAHVTQETAEMLEEGGDGLLTMFANEDGFFIYAPEDPEEWDERPIPADLVACMRKARALGCHHVMLDRDAPVFEGLPTYEW